jgi:hypothetical protein
VKRPGAVAQSLNLLRRHLPADRIAAIQKVAERTFADVARERDACQADAAARQAAGRQKGGRHGGRGRPKASASREAQAIRATAATAVRLSISRASLERADTVERAAPALTDQVAAGRLRGTAALRQVQKQAVLARMQATPWPTGQYPVIVVDPPWPYDKRGEDPTHRAATPHPVMSLEAIRAMPIPATRLIASCGSGPPTPSWRRRTRSRGAGASPSRPS